MSVKERLEDAQLLHQANRNQGAMLSVLVAVAATSRKRRPFPTKDWDAFESFLKEEMLAVMGGVVQNFHVRFRGEMMRLEHVLYKFLRCELAHEAQLPSDVRFFQEDPPGTLTIDVQDTYFGLSYSWMAALSKVVRFAPENAAEFPDVGEMPEEVVKWFLFEKHCDSKHVPEYWEARSGHDARWHSRLSALSDSRPSSTCCVSATANSGPFAKIRVIHPNAYRFWTPSDETRLKDEFAAGRKISELAREFGRQPSAIRSRLRKLGVLA